MHIGVKIPNWGRAAGPDEVAAVAEAADERGFHSVWVSDHVAMPAAADASSHGLDPTTPFLDPLTTLAFVAARTRRVQLGTGVYVLPLRQPLVTAKHASSVDVLSDGRLLLGVGVGWLRDEFELLGASWGTRGKDTDTAVAAMREAWKSNEGGVQMWPKPVGSMPILIGGDSPAALARTVRSGDGWYGSGLTAAQFRDVAGELSRRMTESNADGSLLLGNRAAAVTPDTARETVASFAHAGADFVVLDVEPADPGTTTDWIHRTADALGLDPAEDPDEGTALRSRRTWA